MKTAKYKGTLASRSYGIRGGQMKGESKHMRLTISHLTGKPSRHLGTVRFMSRECDGHKISHVHLSAARFTFYFPTKKGCDGLTRFSR